MGTDIHLCVERRQPNGKWKIQIPPEPPPALGEGTRWWGPYDCMYSTECYGAPPNEACTGMKCRACLGTKRRAGALTGFDEVDARQTAFSTGLVVCVEDDAAHADEIAGYVAKGYVPRRWDNPNTKKPMVDLQSPIDKATFITTCRDQFDRLKTYARLDVNGWTEPGKMGWWGMSSATAGTKADYAKAFREWLTSGDQRDWIVVVDCHI